MGLTALDVTESAISKLSCLPLLSVSLHNNGKAVVAMKEIKFRAWRDATKKMFRLDELRWRNIGTPAEQMETQMMLATNFDIMQSTGLMDKNGVEIYEGDVVRFLFSEWEHHRDRVVSWDADRAMFSTAQEGDEDGEYLGIIPYCEVLGNVYENPELLQPPGSVSV